MSKAESPSDVVRWLENQSSGAWPAILGSLSLRRSPCIRESCQACLSGEQHQSYVLYGRLQELLYEAAPRYVRALKRQRAKAAKGRAG